MKGVNCLRFRGVQRAARARENANGFFKGVRYCKEWMAATETRVRGARQRESSRTKGLLAVRTRRRCAHSDVGKLERLKDYRCILRLGF